MFWAVTDSGRDLKFNFIGVLIFLTVPSPS